MPSTPDGMTFVEVSEREFPYQGTTRRPGAVLLVSEETATYACDEAAPPFAERLSDEEAADRGLFRRFGLVEVDDEGAVPETAGEQTAYHFTPAASQIIGAEGLHLSDYDGPATGPKDGRHVTAGDVRQWFAERDDDIEVPEVDITEKARALAHEEGVDVTRIDGSGKGGRIVKADVEEAIES